MEKNWKKLENRWVKNYEKKLKKANVQYSQIGIPRGVTFCQCHFFVLFLAFILLNRSCVANLFFAPLFYSHHAVLHLYLGLTSISLIIIVIIIIIIIIIIIRVSLFSIHECMENSLVLIYELRDEDLYFYIFYFKTFIKVIKIPE